MSGRTSVDSVTVARAVRAAVEAVPNVAEVSSGRFARVGTFGPNDVVYGIALSVVQGGVTFDVHIIASSGTESLPGLAESVRKVTCDTAHTLGVASVREINVAIEDLRDEESPS